eukprot:TRINITY_DN1980_c0_g1_i2.p1 TRINITY_DN1980_c0_g1~~TRINITY_DN1980_c0_g1_i2.p1  ORF type:complete len:526 (-),score=220.44 TRINITY_DN1980_c0_g1_i2:37-1614(-)
MGGAGFWSCLFLLFVSVVAQPTSWTSDPTYSGLPLLYKTFTLPYTPLETVDPLLPYLSKSNVSAPYQGYPSFSADIFNVGDGSFYAITNRGPFVSCGSNAEYLPFPDFAPTAIRFDLTFTEPTSEGNITVRPNSYYWLRAKDENYQFRTATGLSPNVNYFADSTCKTSLTVNPFGRSPADGIDPGAFAVLKKKQAYLIGEGNAPSLVVTDSTGQYRIRYVPAYSSLVDGQTSSAFTRNLPGVFGSTRKTRDIGGGAGFGGIAVTEGEKTAWAILRRPLGSDDATSSTLNANIHRVLKLDISDPYNLQVVGLYFYQTSPLSAWMATDNTTKATDIKVTGLAPLNDNTFLVLERGKSNSFVHAVDFSQATNLMNDPESTYIPVLINEERSHRGQPLPFSLPTKTQILDLSQSGLSATTKAEGIAIVSDTIIALTDDNGWQGKSFQIHTVQLGKPLPYRSQPQAATPKYFETGPRSVASQSATTTADSAAAAASTTTVAAAATIAASTTTEVPHTYTLNFNFGGIVQN